MAMYMRLEELALARARAAMATGRAIRAADPLVAQGLLLLVSLGASVPPELAEIAVGAAETDSLETPYGLWFSTIRGDRSLEAWIRARGGDPSLLPRHDANSALWYVNSRADADASAEAFADARVAAAVLAELAGNGTTMSAFPPATRYALVVGAMRSFGDPAAFGRKISGRTTSVLTHVLSRFYEWNGRQRLGPEVWLVVRELGIASSRADARETLTYGLNALDPTLSEALLFEVGDATSAREYVREAIYRGETPRAWEFARQWMRRGGGLEPIGRAPRYSPADVERARLDAYVSGAQAFLSTRHRTSKLQTDLWDRDEDARIVSGVVRYLLGI